MIDSLLEPCFNPRGRVEIVGIELEHWYKGFCSDTADLQSAVELDLNSL
jgi:hypothetical protein